MTANHQRPVETGLWDDIPLNERKCKFCTTDDIGNEYHYLFTCDFFKRDRTLYLKLYFYAISQINASIGSFFTSTNEATLELSKVVAILMEKFSV